MLLVTSAMVRVRVRVSKPFGTFGKYTEVRDYAKHTNILQSEVVGKTNVHTILHYHLIQLSTLSLAIFIIVEVINVLQGLNGEKNVVMSPQERSTSNATCIKVFPALSKLASSFACILSHK